MRGRSRFGSGEMGLLLFLLAGPLVLACARNEDDRVSLDTSDSGASTGSPSALASASGSLCDRIDDDEALTPAGAEPLQMPHITDLSGERRCMVVIGSAQQIEAVREFYRSTLSDRGFEIADYVEGDGIVEGNLSRTFIRAAKPDLNLHVTIDEFDPKKTPISDHRIQIKLQLDQMDG